MFCRPWPQRVSRMSYSPPVSLSASVNFLSGLGFPNPVEHGDSWYDALWVDSVCSTVFSDDPSSTADYNTDCRLTLGVLNGIARRYALKSSTTINLDPKGIDFSTPFGRSK